MNKDFPPLSLHAPEVFNRRKLARPMLIPLTPEIIARREIIARTLTDQIDPLSQKLAEMSDEERRATFYKLEHENKIPLSGTGLKSITESSSKYTLAIPRGDDLENLREKIQDFGQGEFKNDRPQNASLAVNLKSVKEGIPTDRVSEALLTDYDRLINSERVIFEIEILSLKLGRNQQRNEIERILEEISEEFRQDANARIFEHEEIKGTCRAVISCSGRMFRNLVEEKKWQVKISWFDARPEFKWFESILGDFSIDDIERLEKPNEMHQSFVSSIQELPPEILF